MHIASCPAQFNMLGSTRTAGSISFDSLAFSEILDIFSSFNSSLIAVATSRGFRLYSSEHRTLLFDFRMLALH